MNLSAEHSLLPLIQRKSYCIALSMRVSHVRDAFKAHDIKLIFRTSTLNLV